MATKPTYEELERRVRELESGSIRHKRTDHVMPDSEESYRAIFENSMDAILEGSPDGTVLKANPAACKMLGRAEEEIRTLGRGGVVDPSDVRLKAAVEERERTGKFTGELNFVRKGGESFPVEVVSRAFTDRDGERRTTILARDITERKRAEDELRQSEEKYRLAFRTSPDAVNLNRASDGTYMDINEGFTKIMGYSREDCIGKSSIELNIWESSKDRERLATALKRDGFVENMEARFRGKNGRIRIGLMSARLLEINQESVILSITRDISDFKETEEALRESENKFRNFAEHSFVGVYMIQDGVFKYVNPKFAEIFGYTVEAQLQRRLSGRIKTVQYGFKGIKKSGENIHVEIFGSSIFLKGSPAATGTMLDITERKQAEDAIRKSEALLLESQAIAHLGSWELDLVVNRLIWSDEVYRIFGLCPEGFAPSYEAFLEAVHPDDRVAVDAAYSDSVRDGKDTYEIEHRVVKKETGEIRHVHEKCTHVRDTSGKIVRSIGMVHDITDRKHAEEKIRQSEDLLRAAFENAPVGMAIIDTHRRFIKVNEKICRILGYSSYELEGRSFNSFTHPDDRAGGRERWKQLLNSKELSNWAEKRYIHKDGRIVWTMASNSLIYTKEGEPLFVVSHLIDISDRKQAEADKAKLQDQLSQAQKMESVGRLAGGVAHDFNNKLAIIIGNVEMAMMDLEPEDPGRHELQEIMKAAQHSAALVRQLLGFARKQTVSPKVLDLNDTVSGMLKMLRRLIGEDVDLAWMPGHDLWQVKIDPSQIDQILANLAVNARDAISGVGKVTIETENATLDEGYCAVHAGCVPGQYVLLAVNDNGVGMSKEVLEHLFEPFFTTKEVGKGTGLGLSTIYGIVKQNDGFINVYSEPGKGTAVRIYLPRFKAGGIAVIEGAESQTPQGGNETVLIVEDEESILKVGRAMLERLGYTVFSAGRPSEAIRLAGEHAGAIHLVLTDVVMPEMNGKELVEQLKLKYPGLKCLYMSGYTANVIAHHGVLDGGVSMIQKPFSLRDLATKVRHALDKT